MVSHHNYAVLATDAQDWMFRAWCFFLIFLPLHRVTIWDGFGRSNNSSSNNNKAISEEMAENDDESWPIWPFRIWQIYICIIYMGSGYGKLLTPSGSWFNGMAMRQMVSIDDFFPGIFAPDFIFNRFLPLKILGWTTLIIECGSIVTIWIPPLRNITLMLVLSLHVGIELGMSMHCFEYLTMLGWCVFLVQPTTTTTAAAATTTTTRMTSSQKRTTRQGPGWLRCTVDSLLVVVLLTTLAIMSTPIFLLQELPLVLFRGPATGMLFPPTKTTSSSSSSSSSRLLILEYQDAAADVIRPVLEYYGLWFGHWTMFDDPSYHARRYKAIITKYTNDDTENDDTDGSSGDGSQKKVERIIIWNSPDWTAMNWLERKRHQRTMDYYENLEQDETGWVALAEYLARLYYDDDDAGPHHQDDDDDDDDVISITVELIYELKQPYSFPPELSGFDVVVVQQPMPYYWSWEGLVNVHYTCRRRGERNDRGGGGGGGSGGGDDDDDDDDCESKVEWPTDSWGNGRHGEEYDDNGGEEEGGAPYDKNEEYKGDDGDEEEEEKGDQQQEDDDETGKETKGEEEEDEGSGGGGIDDDDDDEDGDYFSAAGSSESDKAKSHDIVHTTSASEDEL